VALGDKEAAVSADVSEEEGGEDNDIDDNGEEEKKDGNGNDMLCWRLPPGG